MPKNLQIEMDNFKGKIMEATVQTIQEFSDENELQLEFSKYDFAKAFRIPVAGLNITPTQTHNQACDYADLVSMSNEENNVSEEEIQKLITSYELPQGEGTGVVFIALTLNKGIGKGSYQVVFFDIANRNIILSRMVTAKAGGFGLRNYWAGSVYNVLKSWKTK